DLSIERHAQSAVGRGHGLCGVLAQIDDSEAPMGQPCASIRRNPQSRTIGPARSHGLPNLKELIAVNARRRVVIREDASDAAHYRRARTGSMADCMSEAASRARSAPGACKRGRIERCRISPSSLIATVFCAEVPGRYLKLM